MDFQLNAIGMMKTATTTRKSTVEERELKSQCQSLGEQELSNVQMGVEFNVQLVPKIVIITLKFIVELILLLNSFLAPNRPSTVLWDKQLHVQEELNIATISLKFIVDYLNHKLVLEP